MSRHVLFLFVVGAFAGAARACPGGPCFNMGQLAGRYDLLGTLYNNDLVLWHDEITNILITAGPNRVYGYKGDTLVEESSVYIMCSLILSSPGLSDEFGPFRPLGSQNGCFRIYFEWSRDLFAFDCEPPCLLVWFNDNFNASYVYQARGTEVGSERSSWATVKALY